MSAAMADGEREPGQAGSAEAPLPLVVRLCRFLEETGVAYCHWKSNLAIDRSASGANDLDLLVGQGDIRGFTEVLSRLGFVRVSKKGADVPGIESFFGFDSEADRLIHVHAHYKLILGDDRTKNYRLPIESAYIRSAGQAELFKIPAPEFEYVVLVIRMVLKYCTWDEIIWNALRGRRARPKRSERDELEYLAARVDHGQAVSVVTELLPYIGEALFAECVRALSLDATFGQRVRVVRRLEIALQAHARRTRRMDRTLRISRRFTLALSRRTRAAKKHRLAGGGAMIAVIGGDGSGKSTALATLDGWLRSEFDVRLVHLGRPPWSATTYAVRATLKIGAALADTPARRLRLFPFRRLSHAITTYRPLVWLVCTARDRHHAYRRAHRFAIGGGLVLCDRYPHDRLRSMDVPRIAGLVEGGGKGRLVRAMIRLERRYHGSIAAPELLAVLRVDPEIAVARKTEEDPERVRSRGAEIWSIDWRGAGVRVVDASQPKDAVARELKAIVWQTLG